MSEAKSAQEQIARRRTFAIISHPDAGKTTITEKILYTGGVIREAGEVRGKSGTKAATSDWMGMEQERGVSITSSVMQFEYQNLMFNLLDTPGHKDFGEDTYRTLIAADSAAMLIDAAKGVEERTRKLYEVCRMHKVPIFTFANKVDREGKDPLAIIDDVETTLQMRCWPVTWPLGMGDRFRGLYHRLRKEVILFDKAAETTKVIKVESINDPIFKQVLEEDQYETFLDSLELIEGALGEFSHEEFLRGELSPLTFGSAKYVWGIDIFMDIFAKWSPPPRPRQIEGGELNPQEKRFSGFVFKIQANMDRKHRDRVAFVRICSGEFDRGMKVQHERLGREIRLSYANQFLAQDRETVNKAYAGDILGLIDPGVFRIGDSIYTGSKVKFKDMPRFSPEVFARLNIKDPLKRKQMQKAVGELAEEGMIQIFVDPHVGMQDPVLGAVGELQFDVLLYRLNDEYKLDVKMTRESLSVARWPRIRDTDALAKSINGGAKLYHDMTDQPVVLLEKEWDLNWLIKENPDVEFYSTCK
jgi:peptide chain release factor 3